MIEDFIPEEYKEQSIFKDLCNSAELQEYITSNNLKDEVSFLMEKIIVPNINKKLYFKLDKVVENETTLYFYKLEKDSEKTILKIESIYYLQKNGRGFKINLPQGFLSSLSNNINFNTFIGTRNEFN